LGSLAIGSVVAGASAALLTLLLHRFWVPDYLLTAIVVMFILVTFTIGQLVNESALLAVTLMGGILANQPYVSVSHIKRFQENLRVLLLGSLFILLAAELR